MTINPKFYSALLLTASVSLIGCQTTEIVPPKTMPYSENIVTLVPDIPDSDDDGVLDDIDECPATPHNMVVDPNGCPASLLPDENSFKMEARAFYNESSSEIKSQYYKELNRLGERMQQRSEAISIMSGYISKREDIVANKTLSEDRVEGVKDYLIQNYSINPERFKTFHYGSERPIASDNDVKGSQLNQRVYVMISNAEYDIKRFKKIKNDDE